MPSITPPLPRAQQAIQVANKMLDRVMLTTKDATIDFSILRRNTLEDLGYAAGFLKQKKNVKHAEEDDEAEDQVAKPEAAGSKSAKQNVSKQSALAKKLAKGSAGAKPKLLGLKVCPPPLSCDDSDDSDDSIFNEKIISHQSHTCMHFCI